MTRRSSTVSYSKDAERATAREMGARRLRAGEWDGPGDIDIDGGWFVVQHKQRADVPKWFQEGMEQATEAARSLAARAHTPITHDPTRTHAPAALMVIVAKQGRGKPAKKYVVWTMEDHLDWNGKGDCDE